MIQFNRLRIHGFKSFVDRTELEIGQGLNGVVGPNGCGKSNLVEALRWAMGENSPKRMRGDGMEDVIFNGTEKRAARNVAEVALVLDNSSRDAPAAYNGSDEIEVLRRIERDHGSTYKINGKVVRARDVQILFADTVTGANSPALVSQGRVTQIINAKPLDRRMILEESAGISGLFARRHEAELRLKAADANLQRIHDLLTSMETRLAALKRQTRQAGRYRNINAQIRQLEILIACLEWRALETRMQENQRAVAHAESVVAEHLAAVSQLQKTQNAQIEDLPVLRQQEAEAAAALQTQRIRLQRLEDEAQRLSETLDEAQTQFAQAQEDERHENQMLAEAAQTLEKLEEEQRMLDSLADDSDLLAQKQQRRDALEAEVAGLEEAYAARMQSVAESRARRQALEQQIKLNQQRLETIRGRYNTAQEALSKIQRADDQSDGLEALNHDVAALEDKVTQLAAESESTSTAIAAARADVEAARLAMQQAQAQKSALDAELSMLESFFAAENGALAYAPVLENLVPESGFEKALSRALGDSLLASLDDAAPQRWRRRQNLSTLPALPQGALSLLPHIDAPEALHPALSQIGYVEGQVQGDALADSLQPGQALVSKDGSYWRWDGYCVQAAAADHHAIRLEQKNKLAALLTKKPAIEKTAASAEISIQSRLETLNRLEAREKDLQAQAREIHSALHEKQEETAHLRESRARQDSETARLQDTLQTADEDIKTLEEVMRWDSERLKAYDSNIESQQEQETEALRMTLAGTRDSYQTAVRAYDQTLQEQNTRKARFHAIADERINIQNRLIRSRERLKELQGRQVLLQQKINDLTAQPKDFEKERESLLTTVSGMETQRNVAAEKLALCERDVQETQQALKALESSLGDAKEERARIQATIGMLQEQHAALLQSIQEQFSMPPNALAEHAALDLEAMNDTPEALKTQKEKLLRERESIGAVNLQADDEAQTLEKELTALLNERNDLAQAIEELRGGIGKINREARERLLGAFEHVNAHFKTLFTRLFDGGQAHLALIDSEDPLDAGLEVFAQPPGKTLQSLSLLSGGEQTLASIALIFAMFLTNPSPICVLDEIDAPLDDANVDRVCDLLENISERGLTRFLIITHHRLTMARMDRLYGVTMSEQGVSQLVSVDLQQSFSFLEEAA